MSGLESSTKKRQLIPSLFTAPEKLKAENAYNSTPMELLTEFLFSIMRKDYEKALNYCTQILQYEPHNSTVQEFYPLIIEKLEMKEIQSSESSESHSSDSSTSSEGDSLDEILLAKPLKASNGSYKSFKSQTIEEISESASNLMNTEIKTKTQQIKGEDLKKIISKPLKERN